MKLTKLLNRVNINSKILKLLRNNLNIKPIPLSDFNNFNSVSVSDSFLWRTDNGFKTKFKYSDILNLFFKIKNSWVEIHFFSKNNKFIKKEKFYNLNLSNELIIDSKYLNIEDFGSFYIYHYSKKKMEEKNVISNRCYLGFSQKNNLYSFVHGNTLAKFTEILPSNKIETDIVQTTAFQNNNYTIQKYFDNFDKTELFFTNPTSKKIYFSIEDKSYSLSPGCTKLLLINDKIITIRSNCLFLRPTVFSYKNNYYDVHHS